MIQDAFLVSILVSLLDHLKLDLLEHMAAFGKSQAYKKKTKAFQTSLDLTLKEEYVLYRLRCQYGEFLALSQIPLGHLPQRYR